MKSSEPRRRKRKGGSDEREHLRVGGKAQPFQGHKRAKIGLFLRICCFWHGCFGERQRKTLENPHFGDLESAGGKAHTEQHLGHTVDHG